MPEAKRDEVPLPAAPTAAQALEALDSIDAFASNHWPHPLKELAATLRQHIESTATELEAMRPSGVVISAYTVGEARSLNAITIQRVGQIDGPDLWAVRRSGECLNKSGEWEWEPQPSSRDDDFLARCRFATHQEAIAAALTQGGK